MEEDHKSTETPAPSPSSEAIMSEKTGKRGFVLSYFMMTATSECLGLFHACLCDTLLPNKCLKLHKIPMNRHCHIVLLIIVHY